MPVFGVISLLLLQVWASAQTPQVVHVSDDFFAEVLEEKLPLARFAPVAYRSNQDLRAYVLEYSFSFLAERSQYDVVVRTPESRSIYDQIRKILQDNPRVTPQEIKNKIQINEWRLSSRQCPAIRAQLLTFQQMQIPLPADDILLHPLIHRFQVYRGIQRMDFEIHDDDHPLVRWALATRESLQKCIEAGRALK